MKILSRTVLVVLVLALMAQQESRAAQGGVFMTYGPTTQSCGAWVSASIEEKQVLLWWIFGFVSGADYVRKGELTKTDTHGIEVWVDKYCGDDPLVPLPRAAIDLVAELSVRALR